MFHYSFLFTFVLFPIISVAECGLYRISGTIQQDKNLNFEFLINANTRSEIKLALPRKESFKYLPYLNRPTSAEVIITSKMDNTKGIVSSVEKLSFDVDQLNTIVNSQFILVQSKDCQK